MVNPIPPLFRMCINHARSKVDERKKRALVRCAPALTEINKDCAQSNQIDLDIVENIAYDY